MTLERGDAVLVTGGAGYLGGAVVQELLRAGHPVRVLDVLLHGQDDVAAALASQGADVVVGDLLDAGTRAAALRDVAGVVHLAAIVGDPACARAPELSHRVNEEGSIALAAEVGGRRMVFASTCSNYGRMADANGLVDEDAVLAPVSLYAEQKVRTEAALQDTIPDLVRLRFATLFGIAPRMRFDLTVNEFTRDLWADRRLEVFGEQFWRPYVHVRDAAVAVRLALQSPGPGEQRVFNVGATTQNHRKADIVRMIREQTDAGEVVSVRRDEDPRDYRVRCDRVQAALGFTTTRTVPDGIAEIIAALDAGQFGDPFDDRYRNVA